VTLWCSSEVAQLQLGFLQKQRYVDIARVEEEWSFTLNQAEESPGRNQIYSAACDLELGSTGAGR